MIGSFVISLFLSIKKRLFLVYAIGLLLCLIPFLFCRNISAHDNGYPHDFDFGWPVRYGYTQSDAGPAGINPFAFLLDASLGVLLWYGLYTGYRKIRRVSQKSGSSFEK